MQKVHFCFNVFMYVCGCPVSYRLHSAAEGRPDIREVRRREDEAVRVPEKCRTARGGPRGGH
jgi:hypothetical protein